MSNNFEFDGKRLNKTGDNVTPEDMADMLCEEVEDNPEEIQSVIVVVKRRTDRGDLFEIGYTTNSVDSIMGTLEIAKAIVQDRFFGGNS